MLFSSAQKLKTKEDFQKIFKHGKRLFSQAYILYYQKNNLPYARLGVITSKRNIPTAVRRNKVKRIAREAFRLQQEKLTGFDLVVIARREANLISNQELHACLESLFSKLQK